MCKIAMSRLVEGPGYTWALGLEWYETFKFTEIIPKSVAIFVIPFDPKRHGWCFDAWIWHKPSHQPFLVGGFKPVKNIRQIGSFPHMRVKIKKVWNHHPDSILASLIPQTSALSSSLPCSSSGRVFLAKPDARYTMKGSKPWRIFEDIPLGSPTRLHISANGKLVVCDSRDAPK